MLFVFYKQRQECVFQLKTVAEIKFKRLFFTLMKEFLKYLLRSSLVKLRKGFFNELISIFIECAVLCC